MYGTGIRQLLRDLTLLISHPEPFRPHRFDGLPIMRHCALDHIAQRNIVLMNV